MIDRIVQEAIIPACKLINIPDTREARVLLLTIGLQESGFKVRRQYGNGPATGFWQFEKGGGVRGVLRHFSSKDKAIALCEARGVKPTESAVWDALQRDDVLAAGFARLLLYTDSKRLPEVGQIQIAWEYYLRNWRPGKPHPATWQDHYATALSKAYK